MRLKYKLLTLHIFIVCLTMLFMFLIYDSFRLNQDNTHQNQIKQILTINKEYMNSQLQSLIPEIEKIQPLFLMLDNELKKIATSEDINLELLKNQLTKKFNFKEKDLSLSTFILNKKYETTKSTNTFNINYNIAINENEKKTLDKISQNNTLIQSKGIFFDSFDQKITKFAFLKLKDSTYLGIEIIFNLSKKHKNDFTNLVRSLHSKLNYRYVIHDTNNQSYTMKLFENAKGFNSKAHYYKKKYANNIKSLQEKAFIRASQKGSMYSVKEGTTLYTYIPLLKKDNSILPIFADMVLEIESDISSEKVFFQKTYQHIVYFILMHIAMVIMIFYFTTSYHKLEINLKKAIAKNRDLVKYNKKFIANMVHQIRTPLSVIMSNLSLLEYFNKENNKYSNQINASITTLSNSYENLSYINSYDSLLYKKTDINIGDFLKARVSYFDSTANANKMNLITNINDDIYFNINDIELERIIDNTITNAIKYSHIEKNIFITLKKNQKSIILSIKNDGKEIKNKEMLFEKKRKLKNKERLSLGLYVVNLIAKKYNIQIVFKRENEFNIFEYHFLQI